MDRDRDSDLALASAKEAVRQMQSETFGLLGIDLANREDLRQFRQDLEFIRAWRTGAHTVGARFVLTLVSIVAGAIAIGAWEFIKSALHWH
jgi:hypothetical protein